MVPTDTSMARAMGHLMPMIASVDAVLDEFSDEEQDVITRYLERVIASYGIPDDRSDPVDGGPALDALTRAARLPPPRARAFGSPPAARASPPAAGASAAPATSPGIPPSVHDTRAGFQNVRVSRTLGGPGASADAAGHIAADRCRRRRPRHPPRPTSRRVSTTPGRDSPAPGFRGHPLRPRGRGAPVRRPAPPRNPRRDCYRAGVLPDAPAPRRIRVSAAVITDADGRLLVVRKAGTTAFMQPGGKPEPGEHPAETLARELAEEIGVRVAPDALEPLGEFSASAANEPGFEVVADVFRVDIGSQQPTRMPRSPSSAGSPPRRHPGSRSPRLRGSTSCRPDAAGVPVPSTGPGSSRRGDRPATHQLLLR